MVESRDVCLWVNGRRVRVANRRPATYGTKEVRTDGGKLKLRFDDDWAPYVAHPGSTPVPSLALKRKEEPALSKTDVTILRLAQCSRER